MNKFKKTHPSGRIQQPFSQDGKMSFGDHLEELRRRIIYALLGIVVAAGLAMVFGRQIVEYLKYPYTSILHEQGLDVKPAMFTITDSFSSYFHISLLAGIVVSSPWIFYQAWEFIAVGLYPKEKHYARYAILFSTVLFICGSLFFLTVVSFPMLRFFMSFAIWLEIEPVIRLGEILHFMTNMMLIFGLAFQTPVAVFMLGKIGLVTVKSLSRYRKHVIIVMLILSAIVTSPSPVDQVALAIPMWLLYEMGILMVRFFVKPT